MGYLFHILAAAAIQAFGELELGSGWRFPWGLLLLAGLPVCIARYASRLALRGSFRRAELCARLVYHSPVFCHAIAVLGFGWVDTVQAWTGENFLLVGWPTPALAMALAPFVLYEWIAIGAYTRLHHLSEHERRSVRKFQTRMFLSALAPLCGYLLLASLVGYNEELRVRIERIGLAHAIFVTTLLLALALALPHLLSNTWETVAIGPGPIREYFQAVAERAHFKARSLRIWKTSNLMANAMIVGLIARNRVVLFSDSLLAMLPPRELAAVFAHEIGHAKRHHVAIFLTWITVFFLGGDLLVRWISSSGGPASEWGALAAAGGMFGLWFFVFGWLSRRFELEADLYALELLDDPLGMILALERVGGRLRDVAGWRHFSTASRVGFISRAAADPRFVERFKARLRKITWAGILLAAFLVLVQLRELLRRLPEDQFVVALCLGDYEDANQQAQAISELEDWQRELLAGALALQPQAGRRVALSELRAAFEASLAKAEVGEAFVRGQLLELRGDPSVARALAVLDAMVEGDAELARSAAQELNALERELFAPMLSQLPAGS